MHSLMLINTLIPVRFLELKLRNDNEIAIS